MAGVRESGDGANLALDERRLRDDTWQDPLPAEPALPELLP